MEQMFNAASQFDLNVIFSMKNYGEKTKTHLFNVYISLLLCVLAASCGAAASMYFRMTNMGLLGGLGGMGMLMWINLDSRKDEWHRRMGLLCSFGFFQGMSISPLLDMAVRIDPALIVTAFLGTVVVFACFAAAAVVAKRRSYLYLGGMLGSAVMLMMVLSLANLFFRSTSIYLLQLYGGLVVFSGYVVFDTQMILEKAERGNYDVIGHAAMLFIDFVAIFVRLLIILMKNKNSRSSDEKSRRGRNRSEF